RSPRAGSVTTGGPYTGAVTTLSPPRVTLRVGFRAWSSNVDGVLATCSMTNARSKRTRLSSTRIPACWKRERARSWRKSTPISSRMVIACSWMVWTSSFDSRSYGLSRFFHTREVLHFPSGAWAENLTVGWGGPTDLIANILAHPFLEATPATLADGITADS